MDELASKMSELALDFGKSQGRGDLVFKACLGYQTRAENSLQIH